MNWLAICNRWGEINQIIEVNTSKIKKYVIKECVQPYDTEEYYAIKEWYRNNMRRRTLLENNG